MPDTDFARLPLSWVYAPGVAPAAKLSIPLPLSRQSWLCWGHLPNLPTGEAWLQATHAYQAIEPKTATQPPAPARMLLRGCSPSFAAQWQAAGGYALPVAMEAVLDLHQNLLAKPSLRELVRRGLRWGQVQPMAVLADTPPPPAFAQLWAHSRQGHLPSLRGMYRTDWGDAQRAFVFLNPAGDWLACVTLTPCAPLGWHTELLLRRTDAPIGVLEATLAAAHQALQAEGARFLSLGEVPFVGTGGGFWAQAARWVGNRLRFAYNAQGLYAFKHKFRPHWQPLYLCSTQSIGLLALTDMYFRAGVACLTLAAAWQYLQGTHKRGY